MKNRNFLSNLKRKAAGIKKEITALYYAYRHPDTRIISKLLILFTIGYALSPVDLIPDFIPVLGYLDDIIIIPALILLSVKTIPKQVMAECRIKAEKEPVRLNDNWFFGVLFISIWAGLLAFFILKIIQEIQKR